MSKMEYPLLRTPFETLLHSARNTQKLVAKDMAHALGLAKSLAARRSSDEFKSESVDDKGLEYLTEQLNRLKKRLEEGRENNLRLERKLTMRLRHLRALKREELDQSSDGSQSKLKSPEDDSNNKPTIESPSTTRLARMVCDHLFRHGQHETAVQLAAELGVQDLVEAEAFVVAGRVIQGLRTRDLEPALKWVGSNRSRLNRLDSPLEFMIKMQIVIEAIRPPSPESNVFKDAPNVPKPGWMSRQDGLRVVSLAKQHLGPHATNAAHSADIQQLMGCLVLYAAGPPLRQESIGSLVTVGKYQHLFSAERWDQLEQRFRQDHLMLHGLPHRSSLDLHLNTGLQALKTPYCLSETTNVANAGPAPSTTTINPAAVEPTRAILSAAEISLESSVTSIRRGIRRAIGLMQTSALNMILQQHEASALGGREESPDSDGSDEDDEDDVDEVDDDVGVSISDDHSPAQPRPLTVQKFSTHHPNCPTCAHWPPLVDLATPLTCLNQTQSTLVCRLSGKLMDSENPPMALPNGQVYSRQSLVNLAATGKGTILCPVTGLRTTLAECRLAYIL